MQAESFDKLPPSSIKAEMSILGSLFLLGTDRAAYAKARRSISREAIYSADHQIILDVMDSLVDGGKPVDAVIICEELNRRGLLQEIGGAAYLGELLASLPTAAHAEHYAAVVMDRAKEREAIKIANRLAGRLLDPIRGEDASEIIRKAGEDLVRTSMIGHNAVIWRLSDAVAEFLQRG